MYLHCMEIFVQMSIQIMTEVMIERVSEITYQYLQNTVLQTIGFI